MRTLRPVIAAHPAAFGRGPVRLRADAPGAAPQWADDLRLFATTFAAGFLFVTLMIA